MTASSWPEPAESSAALGHAALLMSIRPHFVDLILSGEKLVELRRKPPKTVPSTAVLYASGTSRRIEGVVSLEGIVTSSPADVWRRFHPVSGLTRAEFDGYFEGATEASALILSAPRRALHTLSLSELRTLGLEPPQSWRYLDEARLRKLDASLFPPELAADADVASPQLSLSALWSRVQPRIPRVVSRSPLSH